MSFDTEKVSAFKTKLFGKRDKFEISDGEDDSEDEDGNKSNKIPKKKRKHDSELNIPKHHVHQGPCHQRPPYRQGKKFTAVKVYTVNDESQHLIVNGVPKINLLEELAVKFAVYGTIKKIIVLPDYPCEDFSEAYHVHYSTIQSARHAKRLMDGFNFFGGALHVFYAPEYESITETKQKLLQRQRDITKRLERLRNDPTPDPKKVTEPTELDEIV
ncbi:RNA-binding protein 48 [Trichogramma pretiosum]|uniref:RNA-binding protein 48 n=1 Tax=Trichogramma pretiosum TaxID=7493 RepID=UPI0006C99EF0|nr:RNA-binding protein 48 [Trichogramma pretiosum]XP_023317662.1 RNA-binding protein 48 [Trichogramma pretiosum]